MDFSYSEAQTDLAGLAGRILEERASHEHLRELEAAGIEWDQALWRTLAEAGLLGVGVPEEHGGLGLGFESLAVLLEAAGRQVAPVPLVPALVAAALPLARFGSAAQQAAWLPGLVRGEQLLTAAMIEPDNEDPLLPGAVLRRNGDGWRLDGVKHCVPYGLQADAILLAAREGGETVVLLIEASAEGVERVPQQPTAPEPQCQLNLVDVAVAEAAVVARGERAQQLLDWQLQHVRAALCAVALGVVDRMLTMTAAYTTEREQFGRPIASFQAVGQRAADAYIDRACLRLVTWQALSQLERGEDATDAVLTAKIWCGDVCHRVSQSAQHLHGGIGVDRDYPLFRHCLWARQLELTLGGSQALLAELGDRLATAVDAGEM